MQSMKGKLFTVRFHEIEGSKRACIQYGKSHWYFTLPDELRAYSRQLVALTGFAAGLPGGFCADAALNEEMQPESECRCYCVGDQADASECELHGGNR